MPLNTYFIIRLMRCELLKAILVSGGFYFGYLTFYKFILFLLFIRLLRNYNSNYGIDNNIFVSLYQTVLFTLEKSVELINTTHIGSKVINGYMVLENKYQQFKIKLIMFPMQYIIKWIIKFTVKQPDKPKFILKPKKLETNQDINNFLDSLNE
jgi:hypothetical protein